MNGPRRPAVLCAAIAVLLMARPIEATETAMNTAAKAPERAAARVRVTAPSVQEKRIIGQLVAADDQTLTIEVPASDSQTRTIQVPRSSVSLFEVSRSRSRKGKWALIGALAGVGASVAVGLAAGEDCDGDTLCFTSADMGGMTAMAAIPLGILIGALVAPGERWEIADGKTFRLAITPARGRGFAVRLALSF